MLRSGSIANDRIQRCPVHTRKSREVSVHSPIRCIKLTGWAFVVAIILPFEWYCVWHSCKVQATLKDGSCDKSRYAPTGVQALDEGEVRSSHVDRSKTSTEAACSHSAQWGNHATA